MRHTRSAQLLKAMTAVGGSFVVCGLVAAFMSSSALGMRLALVEDPVVLASPLETVPMSQTGDAVPAPLRANSVPNVVLVIIDALRSDHVSANGYARPTTPHLDSLIADQGVTFLDAVSSAPWTFPANAALMTGRQPSHLGATGEHLADTLPIEVETLAEYLHEAGYYTAGFVSNGFVRGGLGFSRGFDHFDDSLHQRPTSNKATATEVTSLVTGWLQTTWAPTVSGSQPLFLFVYYVDPHSWYTPPPPYDTVYDSTYTGTLTADVYGDGQDVVSGKIVPTERDIQHLIALYDGAITYWDVYFDVLMARLQAMGLLSNTLVVVTADHGQMFGEHSKWIHANSLYEEVIRVPLLMRYTGVISAGLSVSMPVQSMDLMPTILDYAGIPIPPGLHAISLRPLAQGQAVSTTRSIYSEMEGFGSVAHFLQWIAPQDDLRSIQRGDSKLIHDLADLNKDELYTLRPATMYETDNLLPAESALAKDMREELWGWFGIRRVNLPSLMK